MTTRTPFNQAGLTLVELLVGTTLGLLLLTGVTQAFLSSKQTFRANEALSRMQESGRFATAFIAGELRKAGFRPDVALPLDEHFVDAPPFGPGSVIVGNSNSLKVRYWGSDDGNVLDCKGTAFAGNVLATMTIDVTNGSLRCASSLGGGAQPLIDGIEHVTFTYGQDTDGDFAIDSADGAAGCPIYRTANAGSVGAGCTTVTDWTQVRAVRVSVCLAQPCIDSSDPGNPRPGPYTYAATVGLRNVLK